MESRQLRYFSAVCTYRNLSHAADHCGVAQSALSHHVNNLETELGTRLFVRKPRGMEPTAAGLRLFGHARSILDALDDAAEDVKTGQLEIGGEISVGMPYSVIQHIGAGLMRTTLEDYPRVRLLLTESLSGILFDGLLKNTVDFTLAYNPPSDRNAVREVLVEEPVYCIGTQALMGTSDSPITFDEVLRLPLVLLKSGALSRSQTDKPHVLNRLEEKAQLQLASVAATLCALETGIGCTLAPRVMVKSQLERNLLRARRVMEPDLTRTLYMVSRADDPLTVLREEMMALVRRLVKDTVAAGNWDVVGV